MVRDELCLLIAQLAVISILVTFTHPTLEKLQVVIGGLSPIR